MYVSIDYFIGKSLNNFVSFTRMKIYMDSNVLDGSQSEVRTDKGKQPITRKKRKEAWVWSSGNAKKIVKKYESGKTIVVVQ